MGTAAQEVKDERNSMTQRFDGVLVLPSGLVRGSVVFDEAIDSVQVAGNDAGGKAGGVSWPPEDRGERLLVPGFIDTHVHGGGGADTMDGPDGVRALARFHLQHGTTTLLPTTITNPWHDVMRALRGVRAVVDEESDDLPSIVGAHLEGPFISPDRLGAQPANTCEPTVARVGEVLAEGVVRVVTMAPEVPGATAAAARFAAAGVRVSLGHSNADFDRATAFAASVREAGGVFGYTHLFNAMTALGSRAPGAVGAALSDPAAYAELILDLHHVHPASFRVADAAKPGHLHLITDAIRACGMGEGRSELGGQRVTVRDGTVRLDDGSLAGSILSLDQAFRNALRTGLSLVEASRRASGVAAAYLGLADRGALREGMRADMVALDADLQVRSVWVAGRRLVER